MSRCRKCAPVPEEVRRAADLLERRWLLSIVYAASEGAIRFNEFRSALGDIPPRTLAARLVELEQAGVLERLVVDARTRVAALDGRPLELSRLEFDLLAHLAARAGTVVPKRELLAEVWHQPYGGGDKTVDVHLSWLRRKLGETAGEPRYLHTVRGVGVKLVAPG